MKLLRDCPATVIPAGDAVVLPTGAEVSVMQALGGSVTVRTDRGLMRIERAHAGAIEGFTFPEAPSGSEPAAAALEFSERAVWDALKTCFDPEIPVNIVDLGLVYDLSVDELPDGNRSLEVKMTLTAPGCGMGPVIAEDARSKIATLPGVSTAKVHIVWDPVWNPRMISEEGRRVLGLE